jgi:polygalacturonase
MQLRLAAFVLFLPLVVSCLPAQDAGNVVEPSYPQLCSTVDAQLKAGGSSLAPEDEQKVDTMRIQRAIDHCGRGRAVRLRINEAMNAFLSGPLVLRAEVALILDHGVTLFASRDPSLYDRRMGSCGKVNEVPAGCKPLILVEKANAAAIMGDGTIDGRGGEKILNGESSWWEFAQQNGRARVPQLISVDNSDNFTVYRITLKDPPLEAINFDHGNGLTVFGVHIESSRPGAGNTQQIVAGEGVKNVTITRTEGAGLPGR